MIKNANGVLNRPTNAHWEKAKNPAECRKYILAKGTPLYEYGKFVGDQESA